VIERALRALDGMCMNLKSGGNVPPEALYQILDFIQNFADRFHHAREETYLFPALGQNGFQKEGGALSFLTGEHEIERLLTAELELSIGEYRHGDWAAVDRFVKAADLYRDHLVGHMRE
jgi:hemerythrin-like domain-containing protein